MKKFFVGLSAALIAVLCAVCAGCGGRGLPASKPNGEWFEVQSITYSVNDDTYGSTSHSSMTYVHKSTCIYEVENEEISKEEYDNAPESKKETTNYEFLSSREAEMPVNRKDYLSNLQKFSTQTSYFINYNYYSQTYAYYKSNMKSHEFHYVNVRIVDSNTIELNYYDYGEYVTVRVMPLSYRITYFND